SYNSDDAAAGNHFFYQGKNSESESLLDQMDKIDSVLKIIVNKRDKTPDQQISDMVINMVTNMVTDPWVLALIKKQENDLDAAAAAAAATATAGINTNYNSLKTIEFLLRLKEETFKKAKRSGLRFKDQFWVQMVKSNPYYMEETLEFRQSGSVDDVDEYEYYVVKNLNNGFIYSKWITPNIKWYRPGFLWYPTIQSGCCHQVAEKNHTRFNEIMAKKEYLEPKKESPETDTTSTTGTTDKAVTSNVDAAKEICLFQGLSNLLTLCETCPSLEEAYKLVEQFIQETQTIFSSPLDETNKAVEELLNSINEKFAQLKKLHLPIDREQLNLEFEHRNIPLILCEDGVIAFR
ncbi:MAG: hypothetical protein HQK53_20300, partial [Oligoflexia bacterium]|nr:hypothetical protein [Oligoflexia bacterium]